MKGGDIRKGHRKQEEYTQETDYEMVHIDLIWFVYTTQIYFYKGLWETFPKD